MTCARCRHDFCFICLLPWKGFHDNEGCPQFGEPSPGYDEDNYERSERGLHLYTGLDRHGLNRHKIRPISSQYFDAEEGDDGWAEDEGYYDYRGYDEYDEDPHGEGFLHHDDYIVDWDNANILGGPMDGGNVVYDGEIWEDDDNVPEYRENIEDQDDASVGHRQLPDAHLVVGDPQEMASELNGPLLIDQVQPHDVTVTSPANEPEEIDNATPPSALDVHTHPAAPPNEHLRRVLHLQRHFPIFQPHPDDNVCTFDPQQLTFQQEDCTHFFSPRHGYGPLQYSTAVCPVDHYTMPYYFNFCITCGVVVCDMCARSLRWSPEYHAQSGDSRVSILKWAENGATPFRVEARSDFQSFLEELEADDADWGVQTMSEAYELECLRAQPFLYHDFGIKLMFEEAEREAKRAGWWYVVGESVGLVDAAGRITMCMGKNSFAPLSWEEFDLALADEDLWDS